MTREERNMEMGRLELVSRELMAAARVQQAIPVLNDAGFPALRILDLQGNWRVVDELTSREL